MIRRALHEIGIRLPSMRRLANDRRGVSAIEFALLAPLMILLYFGCVEISNAVGADRKVSLTASALANLSAQVSSISQSDMQNIFDAATAIMAPYPAGNLTMTVSCINIDADKKVTVKWSETRNGTQLTEFSFDDSNESLKVAGTQLVYAEVSFAYAPLVGNEITGPLTLKDHMFMSPRITAPSYVDGTTVTECKS
jgi:Flp pilus assembly protein TadG